MNKEKKLQVLCVAMNQQDFSLVNRLNVSSDLIIANQTDKTEITEESFSWGKVKMVSTQTRGVGKNRNIAFLYSDGDILLLSDDDMQYSDTYVEDIISEFNSHPDADVMIFNITSTEDSRRQKENKTTKKLSRFSRLPYGAPRIAIRKTSWEKCNVWFSLLFGGGALYTNGEDSIFLMDLRKKGLNIYVSKKNIGIINMDSSCWFKGANEEYYFNKGAVSAAISPKIKFIKMIYFALRVKSELSFLDKMKWFSIGFNAYHKKMSYTDVKETY